MCMTVGQTFVDSMHKTMSIILCSWLEYKQIWSRPDCIRNISRKTPVFKQLKHKHSHCSSCLFQRWHNFPFVYLLIFVISKTGKRGRAANCYFYIFYISFCRVYIASLPPADGAVGYCLWYAKSWLLLVLRTYSVLQGVSPKVWMLIIDYFFWNPEIENPPNRICFLIRQSCYSTVNIF